MKNCIVFNNPKASVAAIFSYHFRMSAYLRPYFFSRSPEPEASFSAPCVCILRRSQSQTHRFGSQRAPSRFTSNLFSIPKCFGNFLKGFVVPKNSYLLNTHFFHSFPPDGLASVICSAALTVVCGSLALPQPPAGGPYVMASRGGGRTPQRRPGDRLGGPFQFWLWLDYLFFSFIYLFIYIYLFLPFFNTLFKFSTIYVCLYLFG